MAFLQIMAMCVAAALVCAAIRLQRPEIAMAVSLAVGLLALGLLLAHLDGIQFWTETVQKLLGREGEATTLLKGAGIALLAELGAQVCEDAGERALAGKVGLAARLAILSLCAPLIADLARLMDEVLP